MEIHSQSGWIEVDQTEANSNNDELFPSASNQRGTYSHGILQKSTTLQAPMELRWPCEAEYLSNCAQVLRLYIPSGAYQKVGWKQLSEQTSQPCQSQAKADKHIP